MQMITCCRQQTLKTELATLTAELNNALKVCVVNEANEIHYESTPMLVPVLARQFKFGDSQGCEYSITTFTSDHHQIDHKLTKVIEKKKTLI